MDLWIVLVLMGLGVRAYISTQSAAVARASRVTASAGVPGVTAAAAIAGTAKAAARRSTHCETQVWLLRRAEAFSFFDIVCSRKEKEILMTQAELERAVAQVMGESRYTVHQMGFTRESDGRYQYEPDRVSSGPESSKALTDKSGKPLVLVSLIHSLAAI